MDWIPNQECCVTGKFQATKGTIEMIFLEKEPI
jgi:hypothetical protein